MSNLPTNLRQGVLKREAIAKQRKAGVQVDSEEESEDDEDEDQEESWGRKASTYRGGDTADLEIGQDMEDALEEEAGAMEQHRKKTKRMKASDFMEDFEASGSEEESESDSESSSDDSEVNVGTQAKGGKGKKGSKSRGDATVGDLAQVSLGQDEESGDESAAVKVQKLTKSLDHLTKQQRLDVIAKNSPELLGIVAELKDQVSDLKGRIVPVKEFIAKIAASHQVQDDVVDYLEVKQQLLLSYCVNVLFYLYMKAQGKSVANHPVMKQLLKLRYVMEKMRPLDGKLKHQIDRLVQLSELSPQDLSQHENTDLLRPNPLALLSATGSSSSSKKTSSKKKAVVSSDEEDSESEIEDDASEAEGYGESKSAGVYKVPKRTAVPYKENETELDRRDERLEKQRNKLKRSEIMETLREEFSSAPEAAASSGLGMQSGDLRRLQEEADERTAFEEERFVRMTMSRKDKKSIARRTKEAARLDNFDDIGDIGDFEEMAKLAGQSSGAGGDDDEAEFGQLGKSSSKQTASMGSALQRAVAALAQSNGGADSSSSKSKMKAMAASMMDSEDDEDDAFGAMLAAGPNGDGGDRKRRRAPTGSMGFSAHDDGSEEGDFGGDSDDGENLMEDFSTKKKKFLAEKKAHYTAEPQYGGYQESVEDGAKRAASYEIIKNKGLTPHRKKANRNPRVKKREMYDKAVIRRKGQVRDVISGAAGSYGGETTGIKSNTARSRKIGT